MCGIAGFFDKKRKLPKGRIVSACDAMISTIKYRGPDGFGVWGSHDMSLAFGHRRLSIIDTSCAGAQPMVSSLGSAICYNGECYNFKEIRNCLSEYSFTSASDTEVILYACEKWGVEEAAKKMSGMFAFAFFDGASGNFYLVRDRMGKKPLFYYDSDDFFAFASELKALKILPELRLDLDCESLAGYMVNGYVNSPDSIYRHVKKLMPGTVAKISPAGKMTVTQYWSLEDVILNRDGRYDNASDQDVEAEFESLLSEQVRNRMISDVPIGAFLSGGIDSSSVVAMMQDISASPVKTFAVGYRDNPLDESRYASKVAAHLKTEHSNLYVDSSDILGLLPDLPRAFDEPMSDMANPILMMISKLTRMYVTVVLAGDAGDELFAGKHFVDFFHIYRFLKIAPYPIRKALSLALKMIPAQLYSNAGSKLLSRELIGHKLYSLAELLECTPANFIGKVGNFHACKVVKNGICRRYPFVDFAEKHIPDFLTRLQYMELKSVFLDDMLVKVDRATMWSSLEARVPLIDHKMVEFALNLPDRFKVRDGMDKWLLRRFLYRKVPRDLIERPKQGFSIPIGQWLKEDLREWTCDMLSPARLKSQGLFDAEYAGRLVEMHMNGIRDFKGLIWRMLMFQAWHAEYLE